VSADDPRALSDADLNARLHALQKRAFDRYEAAAARAEDEPAHATAIYAQAEDEVAPLIAQAQRLNDERVARLRRRSRLFRRLAAAVAVAGAAVVAWLSMR
jgi:hypothetical protein